MESNSLKLTVLKEPKAFESLKKCGRRAFSSSWLILNFQNNHQKCLRCGWTVPRYVGTAVTRNRLKRWLRELLRKKVKAENLSGLDINFVFKRKHRGFYKNLTHSEFERAVENGWKKVKNKL